MKIYADKIASASRNVRLRNPLTLSSDIISKEGYLIAVRVLSDKQNYNTLELTSGRMSRICKDDVIVGVLGQRFALRGYSGKVPERLAVGEVIQILNLGGVLGIATSEHPELGKPFNVEVLGAVLTFPSAEHRIGIQANIGNGSVCSSSTLSSSPPLIIVSGTCMSTGKTTAACEIIKYLSASSFTVAAAKLSGISLMRDTLEMSDYGAKLALNFTDAGIICSTPANVVGSAKGIIAALSTVQPDYIVLELGDGIMGKYGVGALLEDRELMSYVAVHVCAASDPVAAWGALKYLQGTCPPIDVMTGPATDNEVGKEFISQSLGLLAANAVKEPALLGKLVLHALQSRTATIQVNGKCAIAQNYM